jgi:hypothetical protein
MDIDSPPCQAGDEEQGPRRRLDHIGQIFAKKSIDQPSNQASLSAIARLDLKRSLFEMARFHRNGVRGLGQAAASVVWRHR